MNNQLPPHGPSGLDREREIEEQHMRERQNIRQQEELAARAREHSERERQHREYQSLPHQNNTGAIPIHQPVASRLPGAIHSPGGLLANHGGSSSSGPLGAPAGPGNAFGGPLHPGEPRPMQHLNQPGAPGQAQPSMFAPGMVSHGGPNASSSLGVPGGPPVIGGSAALQQQQQQDVTARSMQQMPFGGAPHQIPGNAAAALGQGQQPILNDALSYLDQVKVQFSEQPDVYNRFLDIMKDFKSQAIDTPGVINRVSELFAGHPMLIQGFNTFLPPGYRIECGGNDPNTIRVTTPMGTTVQSITGSGRALPDTSVPPTSNGTYYGAQRQANGWQPQQPQQPPAPQPLESPEAVFSPQAQSSTPVFAQAQAQAQAQQTYEAQQAAATHQQQQRGVSQLQNAIASATGQGPPRSTMTPTPGGQGGSANGAGQQPGIEKRGPVEFNHAISYVNKIKNRFQDKPEIYKQFLEILQTYQRESKPIQDVYAQVTTLFSTAPDLLEDFKQFLPESAAHAKAQAAQRAMEQATLDQQMMAGQQLGPARGEPKMPPVGNFAPPPSASKETKKRPRPAAASMNQMPLGDGRASLAQSGNANKRLKTGHGTSRAILPSESMHLSPTLTPVMPEPIAPTSTTMATDTELAFFDKVKKYLAKKEAMNEFLKLCNLFSQDLLEVGVLVHKVSKFIGANADLMQQFKTMVGYVESDGIVENRPRVPPGRVSLSNCRALGPSYRLLPKRERCKPCTGRDEMCFHVLNDEWASHPTWASEEAGFVAHRKNQFEEALHRIEEERHEYDYHIEINSKVIQLLEPVGTQILSMSREDVAHFKMPAGLAQSTIYKRILKKVYGNEAGADTVNNMFRDPIAVLPVVLTRLKQKDEEWRYLQREWEKIWRTQTEHMFLRSLDHMGISVKQQDKKDLSVKAIVDKLKTRHEEQRRKRAIGEPMARHQFAYEFKDRSLVIDAIRLLVLYLSNSTHTSLERERLSNFFQEFIPAFFDVDRSDVQDRVQGISPGSPEEEAEEAPPAELPNGRGRRNGAAKGENLRRTIFAKGGNKGRAHKEGSAMSDSKESTPEVGPAHENDDPMDISEQHPGQDWNNERWLASTPAAGAGHNDVELNADEPYKRQVINFYCNQTIYVFFQLFQVLYSRLQGLKLSEEDVAQEVQRAKADKPAKKMGWIPANQDVPMLDPDDQNDTYYAKTLAFVEDFVTGEVDDSRFQEYLRFFYLKRGWAMYTVVDLLKSICKTAQSCTNPDGKEKSLEIINKFLRNREAQDMTFDMEIAARKQAEKWLKDDGVFLIRWDPRTRECFIRWVQLNENTFELSDLERKEQWQYYITSYSRREPTEGIKRSRLRTSVLSRNLPSVEDTEQQLNAKTKALAFEENLALQIDVNTYKIRYRVDRKTPAGQMPEEFRSVDWYVYRNRNEQVKDRERVKDARNTRFKEKYEWKCDWAKGMSRDEVQRITMDFNRKYKDPERMGEQSNAGGDVEMGGTETAAAAPAAGEEEL